MKQTHAASDLAERHAAFGAGAIAACAYVFLAGGSHRHRVLVQVLTWIRPISARHLRDF